MKDIIIYFIGLVPSLSLPTLKTKTQYKFSFSPRENFFIANSITISGLKLVKNCSSFKYSCSKVFPKILESERDCWELMSFFDKLQNNRWILSFICRHWHMSKVVWDWSTLTRLKTWCYCTYSLQFLKQHVWLIWMPHCSIRKSQRVGCMPVCKVNK